jgi:hypothetical protein
VSDDPDDLPQVRERETLAREEKETLLKFAKEGPATIFSEHRGVCSRLLRHSDVSVRWVTLADGSRCEDVGELDSTDTITAVRATAPVGLLKVQASPRESGSLADVVTGVVVRDREVVTK